jgi:beta-glucosidase
VKLSFDVANTGSRDGDEVAQVYVRRPASGPGDPVRSLCAFERVSIAKGQSRHVELTFPAASLRRWDTVQHGYVVDSGQYKLEIGASSDDARLTGMVEVAN